MKMSKLFFACIFLSLAAASVMAQSSDEKAIRKLMDDQAAAWNRGDLEGFMKGYWMSDKLTFIGSRGVTRGWQQTLDNYKKSYPTKEKMGTLTFSELEFDLISKDAISVTGHWALMRDGDAPAGYFTLLFRKKKEGWRIVQDHTS